MSFIVSKSLNIKRQPINQFGISGLIPFFYYCYYYDYCYLIFAATNSTWFLLLFYWAGGGFSRGVTIGWVRGTWHLSFLGHPLCWPRVWHCRQRSKITQTRKATLMAALKQEKISEMTQHSFPALTQSDKASKHGEIYNNINNTLYKTKTKPLYSSLHKFMSTEIGVEIELCQPI